MCHSSAGRLVEFSSRARSALEARWERDAWLVITENFDHKILAMYYEPVTFRLPGGVYTPDFMVILEGTGEVIFIETKGSKKQTNYRDARSKLRAAASLYPFRFYEAMHTTGWVLEYIKSEPFEDLVYEGSVKNESNGQS